MPNETWTRAADKLAEAAIDLLYRQWRAIGAGASGKSATAQVDPEALILASLALQRHERRLWSVMVDWLVEGAPFVNIQRLKNLLPEFGASAPAELSRLAQSTAKLARDSRWRTLVTLGAPPPPAPALRRRSGGLQLLEAPALLLRLRAGFGMGVKADIIAFLLGQELRATVSGIAESLACSVPTAFRALQDMMAAGFVKSDQVPAATEYQIAGDTWTRLLGRGNTLVWWRWWAEVLSYVIDVVETAERFRVRPMTEYVLGVRLRETGERHAKALNRIRITGLRLEMPETATPTEWLAFNEKIRDYLESRG